MTGILLYWITIAFPNAISARVFRQRTESKLDTLATATIDTMYWISEHQDIKAVSRVMAETVWVEKYILRQHNAAAAEVQEDGVEGTWFAESSDDIPGSALFEAQRTVVCLYVHGGGYCGGNPWQGVESHIKFIKQFNKIERGAGKQQRRLAIFAVRYPLAPDNAWPAQLHSVRDAFVWLNKQPVHRLVFAGDSAGAHCIIHLMKLLGSTKSLAELPLQPSAMILKSPWVDPNFKFGSPVSGFDYVSPEATINFSKAAFGDNAADREILDILPEDFNLPPRTFVTCGGSEFLAPAIREFVGTLRSRRDGGKELIFEEYPDMPHVFTNLPAFPSTKQPINDAVNAFAVFVQNAF
ncbi:hypothetical protein HDU82_000477 [Entophlyctis luteolus]|nr:hypothetical protein HDU82_000477 [Entophlyctis luteolus]